MAKAIAAGITCAAAALAVAMRNRNWGSTPDERARSLPGDEFVTDPAIVTTRAVDIAAPAETVWPWLVQLGQNRGGFYSYDWLENLFGLHIHSADRIHPEWQHLQVGDQVRLTPLVMPVRQEGITLAVARLDPARALVLRMRPPELPWDAVWSFHLMTGADSSCRLVTRSRTARHGLGQVAADRLTDPITLIMTRRMLLGIKARAEQNAR